MDESNTLLVKNVNFIKLQEELKKVKTLMQLYVTKMSIHTKNIPPKLIQLEKRIIHLEDGENINKEYLENIYKRIECLENVFEFVSNNTDLFKHFNYDSKEIIKKITEKKVPTLLSIQNKQLPYELFKNNILPAITED